ncbi:hypothetical protein [Streptoalloteichus tenebrarius]|uniref:hypothetical protein n=1 Tax=Streptoalloteichus tenebrarius (strain ATCC 17920 / DSM 40477 / JCM 4838 / CBS 697.72 / NBRC 16177 / NCIMB 11028 / NRRL B-12390 / A12253. 1 / ISP 5477) TaxID=1933 RepID=UPI0020A4BD74|nr:hypothetical protein [Streptoalloteichus tenebrarius]BFF01636.1 hypothetical protein GCM10020241_33110 [Streptoalloteichus tenebrarius]
MGQLSFFSADARGPRVADLAGPLCGPGQAVSFGRGTAARVSAVVPDRWRADALLAACAERGVEAEIATSDEGSPLVRTAVRADLVPLAAGWLRGAVKAVPPDFELDGPVLRLWALVAGRAVPGGYLMGLDPHAPDTHRSLAATLARAGLPATLVGPRGGGPGLRVSGRRRLGRLVELVGGPPAGCGPEDWPVT